MRRTPAEYAAKLRTEALEKVLRAHDNLSDAQKRLYAFETMVGLDATVKGRLWDAKNDAQRKIIQQESYHADVYGNQYGELQHKIIDCRRDLGKAEQELTVAMHVCETDYVQERV